MAKDQQYVPALGVDWLTPLYDPLLRWVMHEEQFKRHLIRQARLNPGQHVLDLGCGTATLTIMAKQAHPEAVVVGLNGDPKVLELGQAKARQAGVEITLDDGLDGVKLDEVAVAHIRLRRHCGFRMLGWPAAGQ